MDALGNVMCVAPGSTAAVEGLEASGGATT